MDKVIEKWEEIIQRLKTEYHVTAISFETWIRPLEPYDVFGDTLYIFVDYKARTEHIQNKFLLPLKNCIAEVTGRQYEIIFIAGDEVGRDPYSVPW